LLGVLALLACGRSPVEQMVDRSVAHLEAAVELLQSAKGDEQKLMIATMQYRAKHHADFVALRRDGEKLLAELDQAKRREIANDARHRTTPLLARIGQEAQKFPDAQRAVSYVRPLVVAGTPQGRDFQGKMPWLPEVPERPEGYQPPAAAASPATATGHEGHGHP